MTASDPGLTVRRMLAALDMEGVEPTPLGGGLASEAWGVGPADAWFVLRISRGSESTYRTEHEILGRLADAGARVPRPIRGSWQVAGWEGPPFSVTTGLNGIPLSAEHRQRSVPALAEFLRVLHDQPVAGYGALEMDGGRLRGRRSSTTAGLRDWAGQPLWPLAEARLDEHAALVEHHTLRERLETHAAAVELALTGGPVVLLHSDLHEENMLDEHGELGIIDFGQAFVGPAAWEFAALAYFTDWATADATLATYARDASELARLRADATAIALCFGVYRWAQDRELGQDEDAYDEAFLLETLSRD